ncbi:cytochrome p450 [Moniliophthora roreri MCA 2997]|uniref:Cytochrome p450 n=2 Tax=Moniliophthora roreri TaxID=221103 RepID=V2WTH0_MONRO|nr:cytochrome p450 [Moniliophthora roreri MCA 2997]
MDGLKFSPVHFVLAGGLAFLAYKVLTRKTTTLPGPPGLPLIGNLLDLNVEYLYTKCQEWGKVYGDVFSLNVLGGTMVIVNSAEAANEFFDKRGTKYSGRAYMPMVTELMGWEWSFTFMPYGQRWREMRRLFHSNYHAGMPEHRVPAVEEAQKLVVSLHKKPEDFSDHLKTYTAGLIIKRTYGYNVDSMEDPLLRLVDDTNKTTSIAVTPGKFWVNLFPSMKHIPEWIIPGGGFKKQAREWKKLTDSMVEVPFQMVKGKVANGNAEPSFVSSCLDSESGHKNHSDKLIKETAAVAYAAGADTTFSVLRTFILHMALNPDIQRRIQAEIDAACHDKVPTFSDRPQLPLMEAALVEAMRIVPPLPLAVPHSLDEDDVYKGMIIPKGALVLPNLWAILRDEKQYPNPSQFNPDRYLSEPNLLDKTVTAIFGYGRRACAGKGLALDTAWVAMVTMVSLFDIVKPKDKEMNVRVMPGAASHMEEFPCTFVPRAKALGTLDELAHDLAERRAAASH